MGTLPIVDKSSKVGPEKAESTSLSGKSQTASGFKRYPGEAFLFRTRTRTLPTDNNRQRYFHIHFHEFRIFKAIKRLKKSR